MKRIWLFFLVPVLALSCGKDKDNGNAGGPPTNVTLSAAVSTDNSGNVTFTATATNAVSYDFDFGNGIFQTSVSGVTTYRYPASGNYTVNVVAKSSSGQTASRSTTITVNVARTLLWSDEFDTPGAPNPSKWGYDIGAGGWGNQELQNYTNRLDNAIVNNGTLKIIAKAENFNGSPYTSARLLSRGKFSFRYGRIEARAKLPAGLGTWPAIWMLGDNFPTVGWPACGEIDIMEHRGSQLNTIHGTVHYPGFSGGNGPTGSTLVSNVTTEFHVYAAEWTPQSIRFLVDDVQFFSVPNNNTLPFNQNFFIIMNIAMGGTFGGPVSPAFTSGTLEVDYVRVYQ